MIDKHADENDLRLAVNSGQEAVHVSRCHLQIIRQFLVRAFNWPTKVSFCKTQWKVSSILITYLFGQSRPER